MRMLILAEKPSVAQTIAKVVGAYKREDGYCLGNDIAVSWCFGHLAEFAKPQGYDPAYAKWQLSDLPIIPENWRLELSDSGKKQFRIIKNLMKKAKTVVNACDAGREGELIFWNVYELAGCKAQAKRLWTSSLEKDAIKRALDDMKDAKEYNGLRQAAVCRAKADWLVGINATRGFSCKYGTKLLAGRVQSPTLAMIVERQEAIDSFKKEPYWKLMLEAEGLKAESEAISNEAEAELLLGDCKRSKVSVCDIKRETKRKKPPELYDLISLQQDANRYFGYTAKETLDTLQKLYEAKYVTYPRTDSRYVTADMKDTLSDLINKSLVMLDMDKTKSLENDNIDQISRIICDDKISDHHAILPTREGLESRAEDLSQIEKRIFLMLVYRLIAATSGEMIYEDESIVISCGDTLFTARNKFLVQEGYDAIEKAFVESYVKSYGDRNTGYISGIDDFDRFRVGAELNGFSIEKKKYYTSPPKAFTEAMLLSAMERAGSSDMEDDVERKGIGTPATRAEVIEKLIRSGYISRKGKKLIPTDEGKRLVSVLPEELKSAALTAEWENRLLEIEKGKADEASFMRDVTDYIRKVVSDIERVTT